MVTGKEKCQFELYIINNDKYTDFDIGDSLYVSKNVDRYNCFEEDVCYCVDEIASELYKETYGEYLYIVEVEFTYTKDYCWDYGYEYDSDYEYKIINRIETDYFDKYDLL